MVVMTNLPKIDFTNATFAHRLRHGGGKGQALAKAVGLSKGRNPSIVDATAGLGHDGFMLAHLGASITLVERSTFVAKALALALERAKNAAPLFSDPAGRITLLIGDAKDLLNDLSADVIYIDPMHPKRSKSALVKQPMRELRELVGPDADSGELIKVGLLIARQRVVVKWPRTAALPDGLPEPSYEIIGKTTRYCIFLTREIESKPD